MLSEAASIYSAAQRAPDHSRESPPLRRKCLGVDTHTHTHSPNGSRMIPPPYSLTLTGPRPSPAAALDLLTAHATCDHGSVPSSCNRPPQPLVNTTARAASASRTIAAATSSRPAYYSHASWS